MPSAKSIILKRINVLQRVSAYGKILKPGLLFLALSGGIHAFAQDNSPYSRFALGDQVPQTNVNTRGMGGIAAGYKDILSINFANPATYGSFQTFKTPNSKKIASGRAILDIGVNIENRTLQEPGTITKFRASNALFSHVQVGVPLKPNWGLSFGLRPMTRVSYKMISTSRSAIDSTVNLNEGDGGSYLGSLGTGAKFRLSPTQTLALGVNGGYLFGRRDNSRRISFINDTLSYTSGNYQTKTSYGNLYFNMGLQYEIMLNTTKQIYLTIGAFGNIKQELKASRDDIKETYYYDESLGYPRIDSVSDLLNQKGRIVWPSSYTAGFVLEKRFSEDKKGTWLLGIDVSQSNWSEYRFFGASDINVQDKWQVKVGGEIRPSPNKNYFSNVAYRAGFSLGPDYLRIEGRELPMFGASLGFGLPLRNFSPQSQNQATIINLAFEYLRRGNNDSPLKENMFRISAGFSLSDIWFVKRKYD